MGWGEWAALATITTAAAGGAIFIVKVIIPYLRKIGRVIDRIGGVDADPKTGQARIPSIFEDLADLKTRLDGQDAVLETIRHEVEYNNGTSIKDSQRRQETDTRDLKNSFDDLKKAPPAAAGVNGPHWPPSRQRQQGALFSSSKSSSRTCGKSVASSTA